jgi:hypothetical protein
MLVSPMSPFAAPALCWRRLAAFAFQPKRPVEVV